MTIPQRSQFLLKALVERFIMHGKPQASKALVEHTGLDISSATIRNIMAELEEMGLVTSKHSSGGKIPTAKGYRFFVDSLLIDKLENKNSNLEMLENKHLIQSHVMNTVEHDDLTIKEAITHASKAIASLTECAGIVFIPYQEAILKQVELVAITPNKILLILVSNNGDIQNHIINTTKEYTAQELSQAMELINNYCCGLTLATIDTRLSKDINQLQQHILELTQVTLSIRQKLEQHNNLLITGEYKLISSDLANNMQELKKLFSLFDEKNQLLEFLKQCSSAEGIQIFIGGENNQLPIKNTSLVMSPFMQHNILVGTLGIIGPTRMKYNKVISMLDITSQLMHNYYQD